MTDSVVQDPTGHWLAENFSLDTPWRRAAPGEARAGEHVDGQAEPVRRRRTRGVAGAAAQLAPYASGLLWLGVLAAAGEIG